MLVNNGINDLHEVDTGGAALHYLRSVLPNVILCDISMKDGDGFGLLSKLRSGQHKLFDVPIIFMTGHAEPEMVRRAAEMGVDGYILKPVSADGLRDALDKAFKRRGKKCQMSQMRVLLVDDELMVRVSLRTTLNNLGCSKVYEAINGEDAFQALQQALPTLVISDIEMPGGDGLSFLQDLRSSNHSLFDFPVIFLTGNSQPDCVRMAANIGVDGYLLKPVSSSALHSKIEEVLAAKLSRQDLSGRTVNNAKP